MSGYKNCQAEKNTENLATQKCEKSKFKSTWKPEAKLEFQNTVLYATGRLMKITMP